MVGLGRHEATQLACPVEPDEDLAQEPLVSRRFAARLDRFDRDFGDGSRDIR
jgi:hypothetical protein